MGDQEKTEASGEFIGSVWCSNSQTVPVQWSEPCDPTTWTKPAEVTPEMVAAGDEAKELHRLGVFSSSVTLPESIYRAMHAVAPVPLVTEAEDRIASLEAELLHARMARDEWSDRDQLAAENAHLHNLLKVRTDERDAALAKFTAANVAPADPPEPAFHRALRLGNKARPL